MCVFCFHCNLFTLGEDPPPSPCTHQITSDHTLPFSEISAWCTKYTDIQSHAVFVFVTVTTVEAEFAYNQNAMLHCQVNDASKTYTYSWRKGETPVDDIQAREKQKYVQHENGSLEIQNPCECIIILVLEFCLMKTMTKAFY